MIVVQFFKHVFCGALKCIAGVCVCSLELALTMFILIDEMVAMVHGKLVCCSRSFLALSSNFT